MRTVLVVEDDPEIREAIREALESEGCKVATASNGHEALDVIHAGERPGLVLLDLMMPVMNGWQFLEALDVDIPIVVLSAFVHGAKTMAAAVLLQRPVGFMTKPIDIETLLEVVSSYCKDGASEQEVGDAW